MPVIVGIIILLLYFTVAPRFMKVLALLHAGLAFGFLFCLYVVAILMGATKGGRNQGMLEDYGTLAAILIFSIPITIGAGFIFAAIAALFRWVLGKFQNR